MRAHVLVMVSTLAAASLAGAARAADPQELVANAHASATGGCNGCGASQDQTVLTSVNAPLFSSASDSTVATGSHAQAMATAEFGTQRVYADAFLAAGDPSPDAQAVGFSRYVEYFAPGALGSSGSITFAITGSHTPNAGVIGPGDDAELNWDIVDVTTNFSLAFGNWSATDAPPTPVVANYVVPLTDVISLRVDFQASAYAGPRTDPYLVFADYSHTVHTYLDAGAGAPDVIGMSGHDYAAPTDGGVPEPAIWTCMLLGFGGIGVVLRQRQARPAVAISA
ncbi:MAG: hypothetical protein JSR98_10475 [Proteobacteria bacterium]|nr:hypothetical protein [Pseudomonadota bacterium]